MAIVLEKSGDKHRINLQKGTSISNEIKISLDWSQSSNENQRHGTIDLDLGCFYELCDGAKTLIDGLQFSHGRGGDRNHQTKQGCYTKAPYIWHVGDDRGSGAESGETILVNPAGISQIKRIIVYTFIFEGVARWSQTNAVVRVSVPGNDEVIVKMGQQESSKRFCAIASIEINTDGSMTIQKLVTFHDSHSDCDRMYDWGFNYTPGSK